MFGSVFKLIKTILVRLALLLVLMMTCRLIFSLYNQSLFSDWGTLELAKGIRIDASITVYAFSLYFISLIFYTNHKLWAYLNSLLFVLGLVVVLLPELVDLVYFEFVLKRMTSDIFAYTRAGGEFWNLLPQFLLDFWWAILLYIAGGIGVVVLNQKTQDGIEKTPLASKIVVVVCWVLLTILIGRGGLQHRPLELANATKGVNSQNSAIVLNSSFSLFSSFFVEGLEDVHYYSEEELAKLYSLKKEVVSNVAPNTKNVVIIILESFSQEYIGFYNGGKTSYTPFFDSLLSKSYVYQNAYANGKRSVEALPAILSGLPSLMSTPYIFSKYATNRVTGLPTLLKEKGYNTTFYHGGHNGTMGFDGFCSMTGIQKYYGLDEYSGDMNADFDGNWGIFDEPYLQYYADELSAKEQPFFSSVFTLSSHHPYTVPSKYDFEEGKLPIQKSVRYADYALKQFFKKAQQTDWLNNTVFVLLADHTGQPESEEYGSVVGKYKIPIAFYESSQTPFLDSVNIVQQADIMTLTLERLGFNGQVKTFGNASNDRQQVIMFDDNSYQLITKDKVIRFSKESDKKQVMEGSSEKKEGESAEAFDLKPLIQTYVKVLKTNGF